MSILTLVGFDENPKRIVVWVKCCEQDISGTLVSVNACGKNIFNFPVTVDLVTNVRVACESFVLGMTEFFVEERGVLQTLCNCSDLSYTVVFKGKVLDPISFAIPPKWKL